MAISFLSIPTNVRTPGFFLEFDSSRAVQGTPPQPHVSLLIGHTITATGVAEHNVQTRVFSTDDAKARFGQGSALAQMVDRYRRVDPLTELWAIPVPSPGAGVAATGTYTFGGTTTEAGTIYLYLADDRVAVPVALGDDGTDMAAAADAAITAAGVDLFQVTGVDVAAVLTMTSRNLGVTGNELRIGFNLGEGEELPAGATLVVVDMGDVVAGSGVVDLTTAITSIGDQQFHTIVNQFSDDANMDLLEALLLDRFGPMTPLEGQLFAGITDTVGNSTTAGNARNSHTSTLGAFQETNTPPWAGAAQLAATDAKQTQIDPARPRQTLPLPDVMAPAKSVQWTRAERDVALTDGLATVTYDAQTGACRVERIITTYQTNGAGFADTSYLDITTLRTLAFLRFSVRARFALKYSRHKMGGDNTFVAPGQPIMTPLVARGEFVSLFREWEQLGLVEDADQFKDELVIEINASDPNRLDVLLSPNLINQFRVLAGSFQFLL